MEFFVTNNIPIKTKLTILFRFEMILTNYINSVTVYL